METKPLDVAAHKRAMKKRDWLNECTEGGIDEHVIVEVVDGPGRREGRDGLEHAERVALLKELTEVTLVEGAGDEKHDIVDHVAIAVVEIIS